MRDEQADACKCPRCSGKVVHLKQRYHRHAASGAPIETQAEKEYLEFQSRQLRLDAMFARSNQTC